MAEANAILNKYRKQMYDPKGGVDQWNRYIDEASKYYGIDRDLYAAQLEQESGGNPTIVSKAGAVGVAQIMPGTAKDLGVTDREDPKQSIWGGALYMKQHMDSFGGDTDVAMAAYNAGPGNVKKHGGVPPFAETQDYIKQIKRRYKKRTGKDYGAEDIVLAELTPEENAESVLSKYRPEPVAPVEETTAPAVPETPAMAEGTTAQAAPEVPLPEAVLPEAPEAPEEQAENILAKYRDTLSAPPVDPVVAEQPRFTGTPGTGAGNLDPEVVKKVGKKAYETAGATWQGFVMGLDQLGMSAGNILEYGGNRTDIEGMKKIGNVIYEHYKNRPAMKEGVPEDIQGKVWENPELMTDPKWWGFNLGNFAPSIAASLGPAIAAKGTVTATGLALKWSPKLTARLSYLGAMITGGGAGGGLEGGSTYREMVEEGHPEKEAARAAEIMTGASAALNAISIGRFMKKLPPSFLGKTLHRAISGGVESITEWLEEPAEVVAKRTATGEIKDIPGTVKAAVQAIKDGANVAGPSFIMGVLTGGMGAGQATGAESKPAEAPAAEPTEPVEADKAKEVELAKGVSSNYVGGVYDAIESTEEIDNEILDMQADALQKKLDKNKEIKEEDLRTTELWKLGQLGYSAMKEEFANNPQKALDYLKFKLEKAQAVADVAEADAEGELDVLEQKKKEQKGPTFEEAAQEKAQEPTTEKVSDKDIIKKFHVESGMNEGEAEVLANNLINSMTESEVESMRKSMEVQEEKLKKKEAEVEEANFDELTGLMTRKGARKKKITKVGEQKDTKIYPLPTTKAQKTIIQAYNENNSLKDAETAYIKYQEKKGKPVDAKTAEQTVQAFVKEWTANKKPKIVGPEKRAVARGLQAILDLDFFKKVNDEYGHDEGDQVLIAFSDVIRNSLGKVADLVRWGGEEILIVPKKGVTAEQLIKGIADARRELSGMTFADGKLKNVSFSAGVANSFSVADEALYEVKDSGRGTTKTKGDVDVTYELRGAKEGKPESRTKDEDEVPGGEVRKAEQARKEDEALKHSAVREVNRLVSNYKKSPDSKAIQSLLPAGNTDKAGELSEATYEDKFKDEHYLAQMWEKLKDIWFGSKELRQQKAKIEKRKLQDRIKKALGVKNMGAKARLYDMAMHVYIDMKGFPDHYELFKDKLSKHQIALIETARNLPTELRKIADDIAKSYKDIGTEAKDKGVIQNLKENYASRVWDFKGKFKVQLAETMRKFGVKTRHALPRKFDTIIEGWAEGYNLAIEGATNNLQVYKDEVVKAIEDKNFLKALQKIKTINGEPLLTDKQLDGYVRIEHPNFKTWKWSGKVDPKSSKLFGKNQRVDEKGEVFDRVELYAPVEMAKNLNNILGVSALMSVPSVHTITKYNAIIKAWILQSSLFHVMAFIRSYLMGTNNKKFSELNPVKAYREGVRLILEENPIIMLGVKNGLTFDIKQDWDERMLHEKTIFGKVFDQLGATQKLKDVILTLRDMQSEWLFGTMGAGLKAKAFIIEMRNLTKKHPNADPDYLAKMAAKLINDDFGGLHLQRMGRNPTLQHIFRLLALAPDWTESNIRTVVKLVGQKDENGKLDYKGDEVALYRKFWTNIVLKGMIATFIGNLAMGAMDDDDEMWERYKKAWKGPEGSAEYWKKLRWLAIDITPIYRGVYKLLGLEPTMERKFFSAFGHFLDPVKYIIDPATAAIHKGSVLASTMFNFLTGSDWAGRRYTTVEEFMGLDKEKGYYKTSSRGKYKEGDPKYGKLKYQTVTWKPGPRGAVSWSQMPSFLASQAKGMQPVQVQNLMSWLAGEMEGFDAVGSSLGLRTSTTYGYGGGKEGGSVPLTRGKSTRKGR